jgi:hypothetical protein
MYLKFHDSNYALKQIRMEPKLNYTFKRRSQNFLEWFHDTIKSEKYFTADAIIHFETECVNN